MDILSLSPGFMSKAIYQMLFLSLLVTGYIPQVQQGSPTMALENCSPVGTALFDLVPTCLTNSYTPFVCFLALKCTCLACILQPIIIIIIMAAHLVRPCGPRYHWNSQAPRLRVCPVETATCTCSGRPPADSHHCI